jgi:hypothetical protein
MSEATGTATPTSTVTSGPEPSRTAVSLDTVAPSPEPASEEAVAQPSASPSGTDSADGAKKDPSLAKRFEAAALAEQKARRAQDAGLAKVREERTALERDRQAHATERATWEAERTKAADSAKELKSALEDPLAWALSRVPQDEVAGRLASYGSPEAQELRRLKADFDAHKKSIAEEAEKAKRAKDEAEEAEKANAKARTRHEALRHFVAEITPAECPNLVRTTPARLVPALVQAALEEHGPAFIAAHGRNPTNAEIRAFLEEDATRRLTQDTQHASNGTQATASASNGTPQEATGTGHQQTNGPGTLTNNHAAQAASGGAVIETREQRKKRLVAQLEAESQQRRS